MKKQKDTRQAVYARLTAKTVRQLDLVADYLSRSRSNTVEQAVKEFLESYLTDGTLLLDKRAKCIKRP